MPNWYADESLLFKGEFFLKVNFRGLISTTFEFSRQNDMQIFTEIDVSACQIWLKLRFYAFEIVEILILDTVKRAIFK